MRILIFIARFLAAAFLATICAMLFLFALDAPAFSRSVLLCFFLLIWWLSDRAMRAMHWLPADQEPRLTFRRLVVAEVVLGFFALAELNVGS